MNRFVIIAASAVIAVNAAAQINNPAIISTRPANPNEGKMLSMEETILSRELSPENKGYTWHPDGNTILFTENGKIFNITPTDWSISTVSEEELRASVPAGNTAYCSGKDLFYKDAKGISYPVAISENPQITYGQFASRNEFGITEGTFWSESGKKLAFYRKDESMVSEFPLLDIQSRTGSLKSLKYPMAGMASENVQLWIYDLASGTTVKTKVNDFGYDQYLTNISWSPDERYIFIHVLDRSQRHMKLNMYDASTGDFVRTLLTEDNEKYVEPLDPIRFVKGSTKEFIYRTNNRDGWRNLYLCNLEGQVKRLTKVNADVEYVANDGKFVYYYSAEVSPIENHLFRVSLKNFKSSRLTEDTGWHTVSLNKDCTMFIDRYSNLNTPGVTQLIGTDGKKIRELARAEDPTAGYAYCQIDLGTIKSADGKYDNYYRLIKPLNFDPDKKYPVIHYVYGGPHSQLVRNTWLAELRRWEMYMAQKGYIVYVQDNRGTQNRGLEFEQAIHGQCGQAEMADQMEGIKMLMNLPYVDKDRIGVHGWSYGGFMTISLITNYPDIYKVAVAGGPVIDWKWYEVMYGERYMGSPQENGSGYEKVSLLNKADDLKGKLLICQGAVDPVVVWEHSLSFIQECIRHNVQVDYFPYPMAEHNMMGLERVHLMDKVTMYFEDYL